MAKRYSNSDKAALLAVYASSGQWLSACARTCGVSVITLRSWQRASQEGDMGGFSAIERSALEELGVFRW
jgi:transposase-like protein